MLATQVTSKSFYGDAFLRLLHSILFVLQYRIEEFGIQYDYFIFNVNSEFVQFNEETVKQRLVLKNDIKPLNTMSKLIVGEYSHETEESSEEDVEMEDECDECDDYLFFPCPEQNLRVCCKGNVEDILYRLKNMQYIINKLKEIETTLLGLKLSRDDKNRVTNCMITDEFLKCLLYIMMNYDGTDMINRLNDKFVKYNKYIKTYFLYVKATKIKELMNKVSELDETLENSNLPRRAIDSIVRERDERGENVEKKLRKYGLDMQTVYDACDDIDLFINCFTL